MKQLKGRVAVVTGAASGIGRALAERFASEGMSVVLADVEAGKLAEARDVVASRGARALAVVTDVSKAADVEALAARAFAELGAVHVLCNNAGVATGGFSWERPLEDWEWVLGVNLWGVVHGVRAFVPRMIAQGEGHVVNTASIAGLIAPAGMSAYCATKHAVVAMSECLHHELVMATQGKVKVSVLCPGWVKTNIDAAERNRPDTLRPPPSDAPPAHEQMMEQMIRAAIAGGIAPAEVAEHVVRAIEEERFYVFTHPKMLGAFKKRADEILGGMTPTFEPSFG